MTQEDARIHVAGGAKLLNENAVAQLRDDPRLHELVRSMREADERGASFVGFAGGAGFAGDAGDADMAQQRPPCQKAIAATIEDLGFDPARAALDPLAFLAGERLPDEVLAAAAFPAFEFTHPFEDGNGHVGRMLVLSTLQGRYSLPSMVRFSEALVFGRGESTRLFGMLRRNEYSLADFCCATLQQLHDAQVSSK